ncbi:twin-arginine translocation signal domain-containing protein [Haladaptatus sp. DYF46]|uniref:twin-arginine translocation signal domain-containing protein n=1 Tax=Haladaptatus sp. DYF46 TaxID=2886041 RepID=UPI001E5311C8|nr:twin-arginine translocation signal domain-containing protein [Haladaptatus sp. DYF46]
MQRRDILKRAGAATTVGLLGGCLSREGGSPGNSESDGGGTGTTETTTTTASETTTAEGTTETGTTTQTSTTDTTVKDRSLEVISTECGQPKNDAAIEFEESKKRLVVTGSMTGSDSCTRPKIESAKCDTESSTFTVTMGTKQKDGSVGCSECITEIEYRATFTFEGALPKSVTVTHESMGESKVVADTDSGSTTASAEK